MWITNWHFLFSYRLQKSKKAVAKKLENETDMTRDPDGPSRTSKLAEHLQTTKERLVKLLPLSHQARKVLTKSRISRELMQGGAGAAGTGPPEKDAILSDESSPSEPEGSIPLSEELSEILNSSGEAKSRVVAALDEKFNSGMMNLKFKELDQVSTTKGSEAELDKSGAPILKLSSLKLPKRGSNDQLLAHFR